MAELTQTYMDALRGSAPTSTGISASSVEAFGGVARASGDAAAGKWDTLADLLDTGMR